MCVCVYAAPCSACSRGIVKKKKCRLKDKIGFCRRRVSLETRYYAGAILAGADVTRYILYTLLAYYCCTAAAAAYFLFNPGGLTSKKKFGTEGWATAANEHNAFRARCCAIRVRCRFAEIDIVI